MQLGLLTGTDPAPPPEVIDIPADKDVPAKMKINPDYASWISRDQIVLSYLLQSLHPKEVLPHVHRLETSAGVWTALEEMFSAQSEAKIDNLLVALANTKKLQMSTSEYLAKMQSFADELVAAGHPLLDRQLVSYILAGLGKDYNSLVAALGVDPLEGGVGVAVAVVAQPPGSMSHAKYAAKRATTQKIAGPVTHMKMTMARRRSMLLTVWIQIGTKTRVPHIILLES
jgi:hypothetical protein